MCLRVTTRLTKFVLLLCLGLPLLFVSAHGAEHEAKTFFNYAQPLVHDRKPREFVGEAPLDVTALLREQGHLAAQNATRVHLPDDPLNLESYSGYFTTDTDADRHMFWWYFPALKTSKSTSRKSKNPPLLIWLQGGPGGSSLFCLFSEMGPYRLKKNGDAFDLVANPDSWIQEYDLLFIDNPVGAGFSYTGNPNGYCTDSKNCVADNLYSLLTQFYGVFPHVQDQDLYVTGESYGGHYVPAFSAKIDTEIQKGAKINFRGMAVGDGWVDPITQMDGYTDMMVSVGLVDDNQAERVKQYVEDTKDYIQKGKMYDAFTVWDQFINGDVYPYPAYVGNVTGSRDYYNWDLTVAQAEQDYFGSYVNQKDVRKAIHVGDQPFGADAGKCEMALLTDFMATLKPEVEQMLSSKTGYNVMIYSGQLDVIIGCAGTQKWLNTAKWSGANDFAKAGRQIWLDAHGEEVAGYARQASSGKTSLTFAMVRGAGHILPYDQPTRALDMITRFIEGRSFGTIPSP